MTKFFLQKLKRAFFNCCSAAKHYREAANLLIEAERHKGKVRSLKKESKNAKGSEREASLRERQSHNDAASHLKTLAELLIKEADAISYDAFLILFGYERYVDFRCFLAFLQTLQPRQAAEILKHLITIVTNEKIAKTIEEEEAKVAKGKKTLY